MQQVISADEARKITKGRTPLVPVEYETACKALEACLTLDEAKYWRDKADALAAWAKIYGNDKVGRDARRLRLHAYKRMGDLARELRPLRHGGKTAEGLPVGSQPGARALLMETGLNKSQAQSALRVSRMPKKEFDAEVASPRPRSPTTLGTIRPGTSKEYDLFRIVAMSFRACLRKRGDAAQFAMSHVPAQDVSIIRALCIEVVEWLDTLEQCLPEERDLEGGTIKGKISKDIIDGYFDEPRRPEELRSRHKYNIGSIRAALAEIIDEGYLVRSARGEYQIADTVDKAALKSRIFNVKRNPL